MTLACVADTSVTLMTFTVDPRVAEILPRVPPRGRHASEKGPLRPGPSDQAGEWLLWSKSDSTWAPDARVVGPHDAGTATLPAGRLH